MANAKDKKEAQQTPAKESKSKDVVVAAATGGEVIDQGLADMFAEARGQGMEEADKDSFAIPFLIVLQKNSPQVDEDSPTRIEGAKAGMLFNNVTGKMFEADKTGVLIIPCHFQRQWLRWGARDAGGGFKGILTTEEVTALRQQGKVREVDGRLFFPEADGTINPKKNDRMGDHRNHFIMIVDPDSGDCSPAVMSLTSTQIKKSKTLMAALADVRVADSSGNKVSPPSFANLVRVTTQAESNDQGTWRGWKFELAGFVSQDQFAEAKAFYQTVKAGKGEVKYEDHDAEGAAADSAQRSQRAADSDRI